MFWSFDVVIFLTFNILIILKNLLMFWPFDVLIFGIPTRSHLIYGEENDWVDFIIWNIYI